MFFTTVQSPITYNPTEASLSLLKGLHLLYPHMMNEDQTMFYAPNGHSLEVRLQ